MNVLSAIVDNVSYLLLYVCTIFGTKYSRMDQMKFVEDSL